MQIKATAIQNLPDSTWTFLSGEANETDIDTLFSTVSWLYRCVTIRGNSVASMPFEVRKNGKVVYQFNGITEEDAPPKDLKWISQLPPLLGLVEVASVLGGCAYIERQKNVLSKDLSLKWFLPWSVEPIYNGVSGMGGMATDESQPYGSLLGFWRTNPQQGKPIKLDIEQVAYFWFPDHAVEIGKAKNYPAQSVLNNAGVIGSLDTFLQGYFERGLIKATLLKYKDQLHNDEKKRVKEWWRRVFAGVSNAHATEVIRGDFETITVGEGIKDLRDNVLTKDERDAIAVGLGIPPSKLLPVGVNKATKDGDDRGYIEDTIIPEIVWIYRALNEQILNDLGYSIVALPQQLRVMQTDEVERSQAALNYTNMGYAKKEVENILGIYVPQELKEEVMQDQLDILGSDALGEEQVLLNGIQIQSALSIISTFGEGVINRENAINMYDAFLGINPEVSRKLIPEKVDKPIQGDGVDFDTQRAIEDAKSTHGNIHESLDYLALMDKKEERDQYLRWLKKRNYTEINVNDFQSDYLSHDEKVQVATKAAQNVYTYKATELENAIEDYGDILATHIQGTISGSKQQFIQGMEEIVTAELLAIFKDGVGIDESEDLNDIEQADFDELLQPQMESIQGFADDIYTNKGAILDKQVENLQGFGRNLGQRLLMWAGAARQFFNRGLIIGRREVTMTWRLGKTEQHCSDCLRFNGRESSKETWLQLAGAGFYPQSRNLECKGYNCDCFMEF